MMNKIVIIIFAILMSFGLNAQNGLKTVSHKVEKGQTLYFLSKKYDVSIQDLMRFNPQIGKDMIVKEGMILKIFTKNEVKSTSVSVKNHKYHTVAKGQTLYSISKLYNIKVDKIISLNNLQSPSISIGDKLIVQDVNNGALYSGNPAITIIPAKETLATDTKKEPTKPLYTQIESVKENGTPMNKDVEMYKMLYDGYAESGAELKKNKGIGNFLEQSTSKDVYLALVNDIESGQVIRVRNLMNNKVIYLKVVGSVPGKDASSNISIKISKAAARDLKIVEDRFLAEWTWFNKAEQVKKEVDKSVRVTDF